MTDAELAAEQARLEAEATAAAEKAKADAEAAAATADGTVFDPAMPPVAPLPASQGEVDLLIALLKSLNSRSGLYHAEIVRTEKAIRTLRGEA